MKLCYHSPALETSLGQREMSREDPCVPAEADPVNKPGSLASLLASACLPKEGNDH